MELLANGLVDKSEYDNLFITGAFSLLDALLGVGMEQVLDAMRLPEPSLTPCSATAVAIRPSSNWRWPARKTMAEMIAEQAAMLGLTATQFNRAQMQALSFADAMEF
jgi:CRP-like cAMP-binding protein